MVYVMENYIKDNYDRICELAAKAAEGCGRSAAEISVLAVSKTFPPEAVQLAIDGGLRLFGENRVQEAQRKIPLLRGDFEFHLIGHLQSNKAKAAVSLFALIHSIDSLSILEAVNREAAKIGKIQKILVQVNTSGEVSKSGCTPDEAPAVCEAALSCANVDLQGLMTIGPLTDDVPAIQHSFSLLAQLAGSIRKQLATPLPLLSMGMSGDFPLAIERGATMIRVGSAIFGKRDYAIAPAAEE